MPWYSEGRHHEDDIVESNMAGADLCEGDLKGQCKPEGKTDAYDLPLALHHHPLLKDIGTSEDGGQDECGKVPMKPFDPTGLVQNRIVGGQNAVRGQFPWQVQLHARSGRSFRLACGGTLVSKDVVVTAAHCIKSARTKDYKVYLGRHGATTAGSKDCEEQQFDVERLLVHPDYSTKTLLNDIGLLWIRSAYGQGVHFTDYIQPVCLPKGDEDHQAGTLGSVSGWGYTEEKGSLHAKTLQFTTVPVTDFLQCRTAYARMIALNDRYQFCAAAEGKDACSGDSGGPFTIQTLENRHYLAGVVSFGLGCARATHPGVYTKVSTYVPWIKNALKSQQEVESSTTTTTTTTPATTTTTTTTTTTRKVTTVTKGPSLDGIDGGGGGQGGSLTTTPRPTSWRQFGPVCKSQFSLLRCKSGKRIEIHRAFYGWKDQEDQPCTDRRDSSGSRNRRRREAFLRPFSPLRGAAAAPTAPSTSLECSVPAATRVVGKRCSNRTTCWIFHRMLRGEDDPCPQRTKHLTIDYECR